MLIKIDSNDIGKVGYSFDNGIRLSVIWGPCTYSDNYDMAFEELRAKHNASSATVEIMQTEGDPKFQRWLAKKFGHPRLDEDIDPVGYIDVKFLLEILEMADNKSFLEN